jgi:small subunit ribosomal protein S1
VETQGFHPGEEHMNSEAEARLPEASVPAAAEAGAPATPAPAVDPAASPFKVGQRVWGPILRLTESQAVIALSEHGVEEGVLELVHLRDEFGNLSVAEGDEVQAYIVAVGPTPTLAPTLFPPANEVMDRLQAAMDAGTPVRGRVLGVNRGGLEIDIEGRRAFCPYSQIDIGRCENAEIYLNHVLDFMVTELDRDKRRLVLSRRTILEKERQQKLGGLLDQIKEGAEMDGIVKRLQPFGAFVDIGGIEGLVHVSEISYDRINDPGEALRVGESVRVRVLGVAQDKSGRDRIRLSIKATLEDPWAKLADQFHEGDVVRGEVVRVTEFGAFVKLYPGIEGLLHVSQYQPRQRPVPVAGAIDTDAADVEALASPADADDPTPRVGQEIFVRVSRIEPARKRISLALRDEERREKPRAQHDAVVGEVVEGVVRTVKPYGVFVDLPSLGPWVSGLLPGAETGHARDVNLARQYKLNDKVKVEIIEVDEQGRIRLSQRTIRDREERVAMGGSADGKPFALPTAPSAPNPFAEAFKRAQSREKQD